MNPLFEISIAYVNGNFACSKFRYDTFRKVNNKGTDPTGLMPRLVCTFVVPKPQKTGFLVSYIDYRLSFYRADLPKTGMCANVFHLYYVAIVSQAKHKVYWYTAIWDIIQNTLHVSI